LRAAAAFLRAVGATRRAVPVRVAVGMDTSASCVRTTAARTSLASCSAVENQPIVCSV
jgi:hypothetical protein